jgi:hypothetical protein
MSCIQCQNVIFEHIHPPPQFILMFNYCRCKRTEDRDNQTYRYCDVHAVARFRGNRWGCLSNDWWMFSLRRCLISGPTRGHIPRSSELLRSRCGIQLVRVRLLSSGRVAGEIWYPRKGTWEFAGFQGCSGYVGCRSVVIYWVVNCKTEGVRRETVVSCLSVRLKQ